jgi:hypothetical protein
MQFKSLINRFKISNPYQKVSFYGSAFLFDSKTHFNDIPVVLTKKSMG